MCEEPLLPYDYCVDAIDTEDMLKSALDPMQVAISDEPTTDHDGDTGQALPFTSALVHMTDLVKKQDGDRCLAYQELQRADPLWHKATRAHIDGCLLYTSPSPRD